MLGIVKASTVRLEPVPVKLEIFALSLIAEEVPRKVISSSFAEKSIDFAPASESRVITAAVPSVNATDDSADGYPAAPSPEVT